jgi:squalene-hopene/tetraprenyl-beta-curcumene cyclase
MRLTVVACLLSLCLYAGDWEYQLAAKYLDAKQQQWAEWKPAQAAGGTCISCHTSLTYLFARPALRKLLNEGTPTKHETALLESLRHRLAKPMPEPPYKPGFSAESVIAAVALAPDTAALDRMWVTQLREGPNAGSWGWYALDLDPWETTASPFFSATLAALAVSSMPVEYRARPDVAPRIAALIAYLQKNQAGQPLHNRLGLLWSAQKLPGLMTKQSREALIAELWKLQQKDHGWTLESLGPWGTHANAPAAIPGSNAYATALVTYTLQKGGVSHKDKRLMQALNWLAAHQDPATGAWSAQSMNKVYPAGSMQIDFMRDAATGYAAAALAEFDLH